MEPAPNHRRRGRNRGARTLLIAASLVVVVAGLRAVKTVALPLLIAVFLSILSAPLLQWLCRRRLPRLFAVLITVLANVTVLALFLLLVGGSIHAFARSLPRYQERVEAKVGQGIDWLDQRGIDTSELSWLRQQSLDHDEVLEALGRGDDTVASTPARNEPKLTSVINMGWVRGVIGGTLASIASILSLTFLVFLLMLFMLFESSALPRQLRIIFGWSGRDQERIAGEIQRYLLIKTLICVLTGAVIGCGLWVLGVEYALLWGVTAFLFNYIPTVGSIIAGTPPVLLTLLDLGIGHALLVALLYLAVNVFLGNFLDPHLMGRRFGISTLVVILSLIFWGWLWGPVGMLLSVPCWKTRPT
jgi:predicted PurR-regulated permease PerM